MPYRLPARVERSALRCHVKAIRAGAGNQAPKKASNVVLDGRLTIGVGTDIVAWPDRFMDENGLEMFQRVIALLEMIEIAKLRHPGAAAPSAV